MNGGDDEHAIKFQYFYLRLPPLQRGLKLMTRFLRLPQVVERVGLCPMTLWRRERQNPPTFPRRVRLGANSVAWVEEEIEEWCRARAEERDAKGAATSPSATRKEMAEG